jgi:hypothetical protein
MENELHLAQRLEVAMSVTRPWHSQQPKEFRKIIADDYYRETRFHLCSCVFRRYEVGKAGVKLLEYARATGGLLPEVKMLILVMRPPR